MSNISISNSRYKNCWSCRTILFVMSAVVGVILVTILLVAVGAIFVKQKLVV